MQLPAPAPVSNQESIEHLFRDACPVYLIASSIPDGCRWLQVVAGGCRWLQVVCLLLDVLKKLLNLCVDFD